MNPSTSSANVKGIGPASPERSIALDVLRFCAITLVLGRHVLPCPAHVSGWLHTVTTIANRGGWAGVDLFFVLSGFLVSGLLFKEYARHGTLSVGRFLIRRGFKIYPAFWIMILATLVCRYFARGVPVPGRELIGELTFTQNYLGGLWAHTWSLAVEEHFYILLALVLAALVWKGRGATERSPFEVVPLLFVALAAFCLAARWITATQLPYHNITHVYATHLRIDSLMCGVALSWYWHQGRLTILTRSRPLRFCLLGIGLATFVMPYVYDIDTTWWMPVFGVLGLYLGAAAILAACLGSTTLNSSITKLMARAGQYSYSTYLWHMPVNAWGTKAAERVLGAGYTWYWHVGLFVIGSFCIGFIMAKVVEYPALRFRDAVCPSRIGSLKDLTRP